VLPTTILANGFLRLKKDLKHSNVYALIIAKFAKCLFTLLTFF